MAKTNRKARAEVAPVTTGEVSNKDAANKTLNGCLNKFEGVLVVGMTENGQIDIDSNVSSYSWLQYVLQRAGFELLIHEKNQLADKAQSENVAV